MVCVNVIAAATDAEARRLFTRTSKLRANSGAERQDKSSTNRRHRDVLVACGKAMASQSLACSVVGRPGLWSATERIH